MTGTTSWWITKVQRHQSLTTARRPHTVGPSDTLVQHVTTELLLCAKHWTRLRCSLFVSFVLWRKYLPVSKWQPGQWGRWSQSPAGPGLQPPLWVQNAALEEKEAWWRIRTNVPERRKARGVCLGRNSHTAGGKAGGCLAYFRDGR